MKNINLIICMLLAFSALFIVSCQVKHRQSACKSIDGKKVLVVYFSRAGENYIVGNVEKGNTAFIAEHIARMTGADIYEVKGKKDYKSLSYKQMLDIVREEGENQEFPGFKTELGDVSEYDVVFIGGPIWWGTYPRTMFSFFKEYDFNGKTIIPFTTNEGSGLGNTITDLKKFYPRAKILEGFSITGQEARLPQAEEEVKKWLTNLKIEDMDNPIVADATTGATISKQSLTEAGLNMQNTEVAEVEVLYEDGRKENIPLTINGAVDMGDDILWAASNIGAEKPWEVGSHYAWGESQPKESFTEANYQYLKKDIGTDISGTWYDAARRYYGGDWRMPTFEEWNGLLKHTEK